MTKEGHVTNDRPWRSTYYMCRKSKRKWLQKCSQVPLCLTWCRGGEHHRATVRKDWLPTYDRPDPSSPSLHLWTFPQGDQVSPIWLFFAFSSIKAVKDSMVHQKIDVFSSFSNFFFWESSRTQVTVDEGRSQREHKETATCVDESSNDGGRWSQAMTFMEGRSRLQQYQISIKSSSTIRMELKIQYIWVAEKNISSLLNERYDKDALIVHASTAFRNRFPLYWSVGRSNILDWGYFLTMIRSSSRTLKGEWRTSEKGQIFRVIFRAREEELQRITHRIIFTISKSLLNGDGYREKVEKQVGKWLYFEFGISPIFGLGPSIVT